MDQGFYMAAGDLVQRGVEMVALLMLTAITVTARSPTKAAINNCES